MRTQELGQAVKRGDLTVKQAVQIMKNAQAPRLAQDFKRLPIEDAVKVWNEANTDEQQMLRPLLVKKALSLKLDDYTPKRQEEIFKVQGAGSARGAGEGP